MDIAETTVEQQLLDHAKRQTAALESLRGIALVGMAFAAVVIAIWLIALVAS